MPLIVKGSNKKAIDPIPEGVHLAMCYSVVDIGTHHNEKYNVDKRLVLITWELPQVRIQLERDGQQVDLPRAISKQYTMSLNEKSILRRHLQAWRGRPFTDQEISGFDLQTIIGKCCQIQIIHEQGKNGNTYANIDTIMALPPGIPVPMETENETCFFSFDDISEPLTEGLLPPNLPSWVGAKVMDSKEWQNYARVNEAEEEFAASVQQTEDDDIPF